jgi:PncC family amidohydrolase
VGIRLGNLRLTLATAESCTGGLLADTVTNVAGSSDYFLGGVVAYTAGVKQEVLGVDVELLTRHTAYSGEVALAMACGVRQLLRADIGLGVTGIAGPTGGLPGKPVGLVYIGLAASTEDRVQEHLFHHDRLGNKAAAATAALDLLEAYLRGRDSNFR